MEIVTQEAKADFDLSKLLARLVVADVDFVIIGGIAALAHGAARLTWDVDICYKRTMDNYERIVAALKPIHPYLRGAPAGLPFIFDSDTLHKGLNFTLTTDEGPLDLLGEVCGGGFFEDLAPFSVEKQVCEYPVRVLGLSKLLEVKRAAGRPKDFEAIAELELLIKMEQDGIS
ncbi:MAG: hypothetical protein K1X53_18000 [Candidatus Sumerlaeaceae bacterium]|nr:hypothetical protein [Candidatus Sumerlaeaceae bacterium]